MASHGYLLMWADEKYGGAGIADFRYEQIIAEENVRFGDIGFYHVILGPSGSGKSALLNILGGLDVPTSGVVRYREHALVGASPADLTRHRREHVGVVFQFYNLVPSLAARENVALACENRDEPHGAEKALRRVGLAEWLDPFCVPALGRPNA